MSDSKELRTMRMMAWERAKGELQSMLPTYWDGSPSYIDMQQAIDKFVQEVEDNALGE